VRRSVRPEHEGDPMAKSDTEIARIARQSVADYIPDAETMSSNQLAERVRQMVSAAPETARQMIDQACRAVDEATAGRHQASFDEVEDLVNRALGLKPGTVPRGFSDR
jgi:hypothetical protein